MPNPDATPDDGGLHLRTIVVGYDGTDPAERALERAAQLARPVAATVIVAMVVPPGPPLDSAVPQPPVDPLILARGSGPFDLDRLAPPAPTAVRPQPVAGLLERARELLERRGVEARVAWAEGRPAHELVALAEEVDADMIVVGTREPGLLERLVSGSVSLGVARDARCDVLVVHPERPKQT